MPLVLDRLTRILQSAHERYVFRRAMKQFIKDPRCCADPSSPILKDLIYGWGNTDWPATPAYLAAGVSLALDSKGATLECGSGISTVVFAGISRVTGNPHWALEHLEEWGSKICATLARYDLHAVVCVKPLRNFSDFDWYDPPLQEMPMFHVVMCDGPPGTTRGGRYGLMPVMKAKLASGCVVLLDDANREGERIAAERWKKEFGLQPATVGQPERHIQLMAPQT